MKQAKKKRKSVLPLDRVACFGELGREVAVGHPYQGPMAILGEYIFFLINNFIYKYMVEMVKNLSEFYSHSHI